MQQQHGCKEGARSVTVHCCTLSRTSGSCLARYQAKQQSLMTVSHKAVETKSCRPCLQASGERVMSCHELNMLLCLKWSSSEHTDTLPWTHQHSCQEGQPMPLHASAHWVSTFHTHTGRSSYLVWQTNAALGQHLRYVRHTPHNETALHQTASGRGHKGPP